MTSSSRYYSSDSFCWKIEHSRILFSTYTLFKMASDQPWHAAFPAPTMTADVMPRKRALMVLSMRIASMLIVDVRRTDYEGGAIRGSINIPAQGFWWNRGMLYELAKVLHWVITWDNLKNHSLSRSFFEQGSNRDFSIERRLTFPPD